MLATSAWPRTLPLVRPFTSGTASQPSHRLLRPRLTSRSGSTPLPFQAQGEISPGKNALLHCTAAGSTPLPLDHESFAVSGPLALVSTAFYPVLVHQPAASLHASSPHSVALMQLRFASLVVINSRWDLHPQECAHAGRTKEKRPGSLPASRSLRHGRVIRAKTCFALMPCHDGREPYFASARFGGEAGHDLIRVS